MEDKDIVELVDSEGNKNSVTVITYLVSDDKKKNYVVYSKGEKRGSTNDHVIYISRLLKKNDEYNIEEISDDDEWRDVQHLLKLIANAD